MSLDTLFTVIVFAFVSTVTPGPNNMMLLASGVNFGFKRTIPHMCGIAFGFSILILCVGAGLGALIVQFPVLDIVMKVLGGSYLLYLAYRIAMSRSLSQSDETAKPMTFLQAAGFQWVNPKAWMMGVTAISLFSDPDNPIVSVVAITVAFALVNFPSISIWVAFGKMLQGYLSEPERLRIFNIVMGVLLAICIIPMVY